MASHEQPGKSDEWYTPPRVFDALGVRFDLDAASPGFELAGHVPATCCYTANALDLEWHGFVWLNPPFGGRNGIVPWLKKFMQHGNGIALTPDRTSAPWWHDFASQADAILFVRSKIRFIPGPGAVASSPAQGTTLMAKGERGVTALRNAANSGLGLVLQSSGAPPTPAETGGDVSPNPTANSGES